jgi:replication-associated recombination protein RarA
MVTGKSDGLDGIEILQRGLRLEACPELSNKWQYWDVGLSSNRPLYKLESIGLVNIAGKDSGGLFWSITDAGKKMVQAKLEEGGVTPPISFDEVYSHFNRIAGYDDVKKEIAHSLANRLNVHWLLYGPPASAKSLFLDGIANANNSHAQRVYGARLSGPGLQVLLLETRPGILLFDEIDKCYQQHLSVLLSLMENQKIFCTLASISFEEEMNIRIIGACNSIKQFPPELLSRFRIVRFSSYSKEEYIAASLKMLDMETDSENQTITHLAARLYQLGNQDVRKVRDLWESMRKPTIEEAEYQLQFHVKYGVI